MCRFIILEFEKRMYSFTVSSFYMLGTIHKHLLGGPDAKRGPLKFLTLVRAALKKITTNFPVKIEFTCFSMGLSGNFHGIFFFFEV